jgi:GTPase SAR1 family protein
VAFDDWSTEVTFGNAILCLHMRSTLLSPDVVIRASSYAKVDLFLVCFSVESQASVDAVRMQWAPELARHKPAGSKVVLVCTQVDLRDDVATTLEMAQHNAAPFTREQGIALAKELDLDAYAETSAMPGSGVEALFRSCFILFLGSDRASATVATEGSKCVLQ